MAHIIVGAIIGAITGGIVGAIKGYKKGGIGKMVGHSILGSIIGAASGAAIAATGGAAGSAMLAAGGSSTAVAAASFAAGGAVSAAISFTQTAIETRGNFQQAGISAVISFGTSVLGGAIGSASSGLSQAGKAIAGYTSGLAMSYGATAIQGGVNGENWDDILINSAVGAISATVGSGIGKEIGNVGGSGAMRTGGAVGSAGDNVENNADYSQRGGHWGGQNSSSLSNYKPSQNNLVASNNGGVDVDLDVSSTFQMPVSELQFDGKRLYWVDSSNGNILYSWKAMSGHPDYQSPEYQNLANYGPIPEGEYGVNQNRYQSIADESNMDAIKGLVRGGPWPGGESSWGRHRIWLEPSPATNTMNRGGFTIHGGSSFGSRGCIDLAGGMDNFVQYFKAYGKDIKLTVDYSQGDYE